MREAQQINRRETREPREDHVERMRARIDQPVEMLGAVMDGMEAPEQRERVRGAVAPVRADVIDQQHQQQLEPERPRRERRVISARVRRAAAPARASQRHGEDRGGHEAVDKVPGEIDADLFAPDFCRMHRAEALERDEDRDQQHEPDRQPPYIDREPQRVPEECVGHGRPGVAAIRRVARFQAAAAGAARPRRPYTPRRSPRKPSSSRTPG